MSTPKPHAAIKFHVFSTLAFSWFTLVMVTLTMARFDRAPLLIPLWLTQVGTTLALLRTYAQLIEQRVEAVFTSDASIAKMAGVREDQARAVMHAAVAHGWKPEPQDVAPRAAMLK